jgi:hypothetical protein
MARADKRPLPPYLPYRSFTTYLDGLRAFQPQVIDRSSMRSFSGAIQSWLLNGLRYLNMIDDNGLPRQRLTQIAKASPEERKPMLRQLIEAEYGFLKDQGVDLGAATPRQLDLAFESMGAQGDTVRKCVAFFLAMAKDAGLHLSPLLAKSHRRAGSSRTNGQTKRAHLASQTTAPPAPVANTLLPPVSRTPAELLLAILDTEAMSDDEQAAVWTLLKYLKKTNRSGG